MIAVSVFVEASYERACAVQIAEDIDLNRPGIPGDSIS
jgi:hypothetical protein